MAEYSDDAAESAILNDELTSAPAALFADSAAINDVLVSATDTFVPEQACLNDAVVQVIGYLIIESAVLNDAVSVGHSHTNLIAESGYIEDALTLALVANVVDSVESSNLNDALTSSATTNVTESGSLGDSTTYALSVDDDLVESGSLSDALTSYLSDSFNDSAQISDTVLSVLRAIDLIVESAAINDSVNQSTSATTLIVEVGVAGDAVSERADVSNNVVESGLLNDAVTGGGAGGAWRAHLETFAMSRYTNQPWNSMAIVGGRLVGAGDGGLFFLDGENDGGSQIPWFVEWDYLSQKVDREGRPAHSHKLKSPRWLYVDYQGSPLIVTLGYTQNGAHASASYTMPARIAQASINGRVQLGRGIRSVYLKPRLSHVDGGDIAVNSSRLVVDELERSGA